MTINPLTLSEWITLAAITVAAAAALYATYADIRAEDHRRDLDLARSVLRRMEHQQRTAQAIEAQRQRHAQRRIRLRGRWAWNVTEVDLGGHKIELYHN